MNQMALKEPTMLLNKKNAGTLLQPFCPPKNVHKKELFLNEVFCNLLLYMPRFILIHRMLYYFNHY
jgi:hypothetical protein